jgi:N6-adenosine-specific RNA methylase IME4
MLEDLPRGHFGAILADPPWRFMTWSDFGNDRAPDYCTMSMDDIARLPIETLTLPDSVLFIWITWPLLDQALDIIRAWDFSYKSCAFCWIKADARQIELFRDDYDAQIGTGYWTRANSEVCLLATRGHPQRLSADIRQAIIEPRREHSRKPDCIYGRIERLVAGPYLELFARTRRPGWTSWGNELDKFGEAAE